MNRTHAILATLIAGAVLLALGAPNSFAQRAVPVAGATLRPNEAAAQLERALAEGRDAERRAARLSQAAEQAGQAADRAAREAAALAARIQASEAEIAAQGARYALALAARDRLRAQLAERRQPLVRLTGALQSAARHPLALSVLQPGSLQDVVHVRAVLAATVPQIRERTAALRAELTESEQFEQQARTALTRLRAAETRLQERRSALAVLETRRRLEARDARGGAVREAERALILAEQARDLDGLIERLGEAARLRRELAALPGPILRPSDVGAELIEPASTKPRDRAEAAPGSFQLPVQGRIVAGFGEQRVSGSRTTGLSLAPAPGAQVVASAPGRVVFADAYRGFDRIVIIEHDGGWTSLLTGLAQIRVRVGDTTIAGAPVGVAGTRNAARSGEPSAVTIELRRDGVPVNPLLHLR